VRKFGRIDKNQPAIVKALRQCGASVQPLSAVGGGCTDLLVGYRGVNLCIEVKEPITTTHRPQKQLTPAQVVWHGDWRGQKAVVETIDEALAVLAVVASVQDSRDGKA
jgi:hypothetical protein